MSINSFFDKVYVINLNRRTDRRNNMQVELYKSGIDPDKVEWFEGFDLPGNENHGCTKSHIKLWEKLANSSHKNALIFEDDMRAITIDALKACNMFEFSPPVKIFRTILNGEGNLSERFHDMEQYIPEDWSVLFLGCGFGDYRLERVNPHCIRVQYVKTTGSYGITKDHAQAMVEWFNANVPHWERDDAYFCAADDALCNGSLFGNYYVLTPRLCYQGPSYSNIQKNHANHILCMTDPGHELITLIDSCTSQSVT